MEDATEKNRAAIGELLKKRRDEKNITQKGIADKLKYRNINFISMLEKGASNIPLNRMSETIKAYELEDWVIVPFIKLVHPDSWAAFEEIGKVIDGNKCQSKIAVSLRDLSSKLVDLMFNYGVEPPSDLVLIVKTECNDANLIEPTCKVERGADGKFHRIKR